MIQSKKALFLGVVAMAICAFSHSKPEKINFAANSIVKSIVGQNTLSCQRDW